MRLPKWVAQLLAGEMVKIMTDGRAFSNAKAVVRASGWIDLPYRYPPVRMPVARFERLLGMFLRR